MTFSEFISRSDRYIRPVMARLNPNFNSFLYSSGRKFFLSIFADELLKKQFQSPEEFKKILWDIEFSFPLFNSAGIFKKGEGYYTVASQGAGAYLAGTSTSNPRNGNVKLGVTHPFMPYPKSGTASNWMGLPNPGHADLARSISRIDKVSGCPIGISMSQSPDDHGSEAINNLVDGMNMMEKAGADFIEINESCPNVEHDIDIDPDTGLDKNLINNLGMISELFLNRRRRNIPVIVKFSTDTALAQVEKLIDILIDLEFDGVNFGNTSTQYKSIRQELDPDDLKQFDYFVTEFGGGVSGRPLKKFSLGLCREAQNYLDQKSLKSEFHIIRTGGIETADDIIESEKSGIALNQWFTGYFEAFSKYGHKAYKELIETVHYF